MSNAEHKSSENNQNKLGIGIAAGVAIGAGIGAATGNIALWTGIGIAPGVSIGIIMNENVTDRIP